MGLRCGLLGRRLGHSYSPRIHRWGDYTYDLFEREPEELADFLKNGDFTGLNVTIPYKKAVIPYCAELSPIARELGAVNTLVRRPDGTLLGHNTDYAGFACMLRHSGLDISGKKCLVLGSGGASATVCAVLEKQGAQPIVISRQGPDNYQNLSRHADAALLVNATPVGMYPNAGQSPVDIAALPHLEGVLDLIYNPARTALLLQAQARGIVAENGLRMLVEQARESALWFTGQPIGEDTVRKTLGDLAKETANIILIGMPGCGKSTVAQALAARTGRQWIDVDQIIAQDAGMSIPAIFAQDGEAGFRRRETAALTALGQQSGLILATGGGCVTRPENEPLLRQNGVIFWLQREVSLLPTKGRPLSQKGSLGEMERLRAPLYRRFSDAVVVNNRTVADAAEEILRKLDTFWEAD